MTIFHYRFSPDGTRFALSVTPTRPSYHSPAHNVNALIIVTVYALIPFRRMSMSSSVPNVARLKTLRAQVRTNMDMIKLIPTRSPRCSPSFSRRFEHIRIVSILKTTSLLRLWRSQASHSLLHKCHWRHWRRASKIVTTRSPRRSFMTSSSWSTIGMSSIEARQSLSNRSLNTSTLRSTNWKRAFSAMKSRLSVPIGLCSRAGDRIC